MNGRMGNCRQSLRRASGFAYLLLLVAVAVLSIAAAGSITVGHSVSRRDAEQALLTVGEDFRAALASYGAVEGTGVSQGPKELMDLLRDPRVPGIRRHLRQIHVDPLTGRGEWGLVRGSGGQILGVYSLAEGRPIKRTGFEPNQQGFDDAKSYVDWVFGSRHLQ